MKKIILVVILSIIFTTAVYGQEEITLKTYYPSPKGIYGGLMVGRAFARGNPAMSEGNPEQELNIPPLLDEHFFRMRFVEKFDNNRGCHLFSYQPYFDGSPANNNDVFKISHNGTADDLVIDQNGRVGIGTNAPDAALEVDLSSSSDLSINEITGIKADAKNFKVGILGNADKIGVLGGYCGATAVNISEMRVGVYGAAHEEHACGVIGRNNVNDSIPDGIIYPGVYGNGTTGVCGKGAVHGVYGSSDGTGVYAHCSASTSGTAAIYATGGECAGKFDGDVVVTGRARLGIPNISVFDTTTDRNSAVQNPVEGDLVYIRKDSKLYIYVNGNWAPIL